MKADISVAKIKENKSGICSRLLLSLPGWFGIEDALVNYAKDVKDMVMFGAKVRGRVVGFLSLRPHNSFTVEIYVIGIECPFHRMGIGRKLIKEAEGYMKNRGFEFISVKTLGPSVESKEYAGTRKFFEAVGFRPVEEFKTLWREDNPCLLMIKKIH